MRIYYFFHICSMQFIHHQVLIQPSHMRMTISFTTYFVLLLRILHTWDKQSGQDLDISLHLCPKCSNFKVLVNY